MTRARTSFASFVVAALLTACAAGQPRTVAAKADDWSPISCADCVASRIGLDVRRSVSGSADPGTHLVARVRNLAADSIVFVLTFRAAVLPDADGYVPSEEWRLLLGPAGTSEAATTIVLRRDDVSVASIARLERLSTGLR